MHAYHHIRLGNTSINVKKSFDELLPDPWLKAEDENFVFEVIFRQKQGVKNILVCARPEFSFSLKNLIRIQVVSAESIQK